MDLSIYRADSFEWIDEYVGKYGSEHFWNYYDKIKNALEILSVGHYYDIFRVDEEDREFFIKFCCLYIIQSGGMMECGVGFSADFSRIKRYHKPLSGLSFEEQLKIISA